MNTFSKRSSFITNPFQEWDVRLLQLFLQCPSYSRATVISFSHPWGEGKQHGHFSFLATIRAVIPAMLNRRAMPPIHGTTIWYRKIRTICNSDIITYSLMCTAWHVLLETTSLRHTFCLSVWMRTFIWTLHLHALLDLKVPLSRRWWTMEVNVMLCDVTNVFLGNVIDKPLCYFLLLHHKQSACQSIPSNWNDT